MLDLSNMNVFKHHTLKALTLLLLLGFIWGSGYTLAKFAMTNGVPPLGYAFWQSLGPALFLTLISIFTGQYQPVLKRHWRYFLICGLIGIAIPNTNMYFISSHLPAGLLAVLVNTVPLMVYPLALFNRLEKPDFYRFFALIVGMFGIILLMSPQPDQLFSKWSILTLISPLAFALCSIYIARCQPAEINSLQAASGMLIASSLILTPLILQQNAFYAITPPFTPARQVVILEMFLSSLGYLLFFQLIQYAGPVFYSLTGGVVALTGMFWGYLVFAEKPNLQQGLAAACVIASIFLLSWRQSKQQGVH